PTRFDASTRNPWFAPGTRRVITTVVADAHTSDSARPRVRRRRLLVAWRNARGKATSSDGGNATASAWGTRNSTASHESLRADCAGVATSGAAKSNAVTTEAITARGTARSSSVHTRTVHRGA